MLIVYLLFDSISFYIALRTVHLHNSGMVRPQKVISMAGYEGLASVYYDDTLAW
jgi:hypothetical protein